MKQSTSFLLLMLATLALPQHAHAKTDAKTTTKAVAVKPPERVAPLPPPPEKPAIAQSTFPVLPPSNPCTIKDLRGLLRLVNVYEDPQAAETVNFRSSPNQYIQFRKDNIFARLNSADANASPKAIASELMKHAGGLLQFLVQDNGFIYFYQNSVAIDVQACFAVANDKVPFKKGQIILMPPKGQITGRLAKVYQPMRSNKNQKETPKKRKRR